MHFWDAHGCVLQQPYDTEVGAGTMHPETFLRVLGKDPYRVAFVQPSRRPAEGPYCENPNRLYKHFQYQVILKPSPANVQDLYLKSLGAIGIDLRAHDIRFEEDNWESPTPPSPSKLRTGLNASAPSCRMSRASSRSAGPRTNPTATSASPKSSSFP